MQYKALSEKQVLAMSWWNKDNYKDFDAIVCDGAVRSGKTVAVTDGFFLWSMARFENGVFALCGKTVGALRRNIVSNLQSWLGDLFRFRENRAENRLTVIAPNGRKNTYYLFGGQDEASAALIQGMTLCGVLLDEVVLMPRSFVEQAAARCSVAGSKLWFTCNPGSPQHWFYKEWIRQAEAKHLLRIHFTMADNPGLDPKVRQRYERLYAGLFYRRFVLGQWCAGEGLVYEFDENIHMARQPPGDGRYFISVDYGTMNPFSAGLWCVSGDKAVRLREYYYDARASGRIRTDEEHYAQLEALAGELPVERVVIDPSAASFIATMRHHGRFSVRKAVNGVLPGIRLVTEYLRAGRLQFMPACKDTIREFGLYRWQEDAEAPVKEDDHAMDDVRYFCATVLDRLKNAEC